MTRKRLFALLPLIATLAGCAAREEPPIIPAGPDALYVPERVVPGRLEYAPDRSTFASPRRTRPISGSSRPHSRARPIPRRSGYSAASRARSMRKPRGSLDITVLSSIAQPISSIAAAAACGGKRQISTMTITSGRCSRSIPRGRASPGATARAPQRISGGGCRAGHATNRRARLWRGPSRH